MNEVFSISLDSQGSLAYVYENGYLVVEFYSFGEDVAYEYADLMIFKPRAQAMVASLLDHPEISPSSQELLELIAERFKSYFEVGEFAAEHGVAFEKRVDFWP